MTDHDYRAAFEDATHRLDRYRDKLRHREQAINEMSAMRIEYASGDGAVQLAVNSDGFLLDLQLAPQVSGLPAHQITDMIMQVYTAAQRDAAQKSTEIVKDAFGDDHPLARTYAWRLEPPPEGQPSPPASHGDDNDGNYSQAATYRA